MMMSPNTHGVLESARKLDSVLRLRGALAKRFATLLAIADELDSVGLEECMAPARAIVAEWRSVMGVLAKIEKSHVLGS